MSFMIGISSIARLGDSFVHELKIYSTPLITVLAPTERDRFFVPTSMYFGYQYKLCALSAYVLIDKPVYRINLTNSGQMIGGNDNNRETPL
jgi:hypothetical protein